MIIKTIDPASQTHLEQYISEMLPWAHGHQYKGLAAVVLAIIAKQTGNQAELARTQGNQEAAVKRFSRLIHNPALIVVSANGPALMKAFQSRTA